MSTPYIGGTNGHSDEAKCPVSPPETSRTFSTNEFSVDLAEKSTSQPSSSTLKAQVNPYDGRGNHGLGLPRPSTVGHCGSRRSEGVEKSTLPSPTVDLAVGKSTVGAKSTENSDSERTVGGQDYRSMEPYKAGAKWAKYEDIKGRIFSIMSALVHPDTGEVLHTKDSLDQAAQRPGVDRAAWVIHEKDTWDVDDVTNNPRATAGEHKPAHFHAAESRKNTISLGAVARAWNVPPNFVNLVKGKGGFEDCCQYLTHEHPNAQLAGKHRYADEEVHAYGFNFRETVDKRAAQQQKKKGKKVSAAKKLLFRIQEEGLTPRQAKKLDPMAYLEAGYSKIEKARDEFLKTAPLPSVRTNYYFAGESGAGKSGLASLYAAAIAQRIYPDLDFEDAIYFAGREGVELQSYEGQPIIIWDDFRPWDLLSTFGGRAGFFSAFDIAPNKSEVNKKYGSVRLVNSYNIVTGILPYRDFLDQLAGEYTNARGDHFRSEDKNQSYRRFPFIAELTKGTIDFYLSEGFAEGTSAWDSYMAVARMRANMGRILGHIKDCESEEQRELVRAQIGAELGKELLERDRQLRQRSLTAVDSVVSNALGDVEILELPSAAENEFNNLVRQLRSKADELEETVEVVNRFQPFVRDSWSRDRTEYHLSNKKRDAFLDAKVRMNELRDDCDRLAKKLAGNEHFVKVASNLIHGWFAKIFSEDPSVFQRRLTLTGSGCAEPDEPSQADTVGYSTYFDTSTQTYCGVSTRELTNAGELEGIWDWLYRRVEPDGDGYEAERESDS